jgi:hypothetical protein
VDNDGDGTWDTHPSYGDNSCFSASDNDESDYPAAGDFTVTGEAYACGVTAAQNGQWNYTTEYSVNSYCPASTARCKRVNFKQTYKQTGWSGGYDILRYEGFYSVCYRYNAGIVTVLARTGDATYQVGYPYNWRGNADGYPQHYRFSKYVEFRFRGKLDFCPTWKIGCIARWPWLTIIFHDTNYHTRDAGIV